MSWWSNKLCPANYKWIKSMKSNPIKANYQSRLWMHFINFITSPREMGISAGPNKHLCSPPNNTLNSSQRERPDTTRAHSNEACNQTTRLNKRHLFIRYSLEIKPRSIIQELGLVIISRNNCQGRIEVVDQTPTRVHRQQVRSIMSSLTLQLALQIRLG